MRFVKDDRRLNVIVAALLIAVAIVGVAVIAAFMSSVMNFNKPPSAQFKVVDTAGQTDSVTITVKKAAPTPTTDRPPEVTIVRPFPDVCYSKESPLPGIYGAVPVSFNFGDDHGVVSYEIYVDGKLVNRSSFSEPIPGFCYNLPGGLSPELRGLGYGTHTIKVIVKDTSGQTASDSRTFKICRSSV